MPKEQLSTHVAALIQTIRGHRVLLDNDLAVLYGVSTGALVQAMRRNQKRFPSDFVFQLDKKEFSILISQSVISRWGGRRTLPWAFTEQGVAMLSGVLSSDRAIDVNVAIMRAFVQLRGLFASAQQMGMRIDELENRVGAHDSSIHEIFEAIRALMTPVEIPQKRIGFGRDDEPKTKACKKS